MLSEPLPNTLDVRKAAVRGVSIEGVLKPLDLKRFRALLAEDDGLIKAGLTFSRDEENRYLIELVLDAEVVLTCQRCLELLPKSLTCANTLAVVWTDEQAAHLPRHLEPLIVEDDDCRLWDLVEDELMLALPAFSYHDTQECHSFLAGFTGQSPHEETTGEDKPNPFNVLEQLKPGNK